MSVPTVCERKVLDLYVDLRQVRRVSSHRNVPVRLGTNHETLQTLMTSIFSRFPLVRLLRSIQYGNSTIVNLLRDQNRARAEQYVEALLSSSRYSDPRKLNHYEARVFSQFGEDGIIAEIFRRVGVKNRRFVEIGVEDGLETNTTYLLTQGWHGLWIDANEERLREARRAFSAPVREGVLAIVHSFVTAENVCSLLAGASVSEEFDLLSIDIDRNTYYIWEALRDYRPRLVIVEYNSGFPPFDPWKVHYSPDKVWNGTSWYGASLKAYEQLGESLGYVLVGCNLGGVNAFFVRRDLAEEHFSPPFTSENHYEPPRHWLRWWRNTWPSGFQD